MAETLDEENARLLRQTRELEAEHARLEARPHDVDGHREHRAHLKQQLAEIRAHMARLKRSSRP